MKAGRSLATADCEAAIKALDLCESDLYGQIQMNTSEQQKSEASAVISFKNPDGSYKTEMSLLTAKLGTVGKMSATTLNRELPKMVEDLTGKKLCPTNKFSRHYLSDQVYFGEALAQEGVWTTIVEEVRKPDAPKFVVGHDGTGVFGNELMHYNLTAGGKDLTLGIIPVSAKDSVTMREGFEQVSTAIVNGSTAIPCIGNLNAIHSHTDGTLNDTAGPAVKLSKMLISEKLEEELKVRTPVRSLSDSSNHLIIESSNHITKH
jgi:hypothetical protein